MANAITVSTNNGPLQVTVSDFRDANGNVTAPPSAAPGYAITGPATIAAHPTEAHTAVVTLDGTPGTVSVQALYELFNIAGTITVEAGPAVTATLNISA